MSKGKLPTHASDAWSSLFLLDPPPMINAISGQGGLVIAGGFDIYRLRRGAEHFQKREPPDPEEINLVAAEARPPFRYAISDGQSVTVFFKNGQEDGLAKLDSDEDGCWPVSMAWATLDGTSSLFVCWSNGEVTMSAPDNSGVVSVDLEGISACAADAAGKLALAAVDEESCVLYRSNADATMHVEQTVTPPVEFMRDVRLAVAGDAVAVSMKGWGVFVARARGAPLVRCDGIDDDGPLAFEGTSNDAALYGTSASNDRAIVRVTADGVALPIAELETDGELTQPIRDLTWDVSRSLLYAASPVLGIISFTPPRGKTTKKLLS